MAWVKTLFGRLSGRRGSAELLAEALSCLPEAMALFDGKDRLVYCNEAFRRAYGIRPEDEPEGRTFAALLQSDRPGELPDRILDHHEAGTGFPLILRRRDGRRTEIRSFHTKDGGTLLVRADIAGLADRGEADGAVIDFQDLFLRRSM